MQLANNKSEGLAYRNTEQMSKSSRQGYSRITPRISRRKGNTFFYEKAINNLQHIMHKPKKYRDVCSRTALPGQVKKGGTTKRIPNYKKHEFHEDIQEYWK